MYTSIKVSAISILTAALLTTAGCANKPKNSQVSVAPMAVPGNSTFETPSLVNNSNEVKEASRNVAGIVHFAFDSSEIDAEAANVLNQQVAFLAENPEAAVLVAGHTDERGSREYNHALGERRAQAVKNYLASQGVADARVETISYGEDRPVATGNDEASHAQNRRAELSY